MHGLFDGCMTDSKKNTFNTVDWKVISPVYRALLKHYNCISSPKNMLRSEIVSGTVSTRNGLGINTSADLEKGAYGIRRWRREMTF